MNCFIRSFIYRPENGTKGSFVTALSHFVAATLVSACYTCVISLCWSNKQTGTLEDVYSI